jgi:hypothetical protein
VIRDGFTAYVQGTSDSALKRKITLYPVAARPRITDIW